MKCLIKSLVLVSAVLLFLTSCFKAEDLSHLLAQTAEKLSSNRRDRRDNPGGSSSLRSSSSLCSEDSSCSRSCDRMFLKAADLNRCYNTTEDIVDRVEDVFDELINPSSVDDLEDIDTGDFRMFVSISEQSFLDLIDEEDADPDGDRQNDEWEDIYEYDEHHVERVLTWICDDEDVQKSLRNDNDIISALIQVLITKDSANASDTLDEACQGICYTGTYPKYPYQFSRPADACEAI